MKATDLHRHMHDARAERRRNPGPPDSGRLDRLSAEIGYRAHRLADDVLPWIASAALLFVFWWLL